MANLQFPSRYSLLVERSKASGTRKVGFFNIYTALGLHRVTAPSDRYDAVISWGHGAVGWRRWVSTERRLLAGLWPGCEGKAGEEGKMGQWRCRPEPRRPSRESGSPPFEVREQFPSAICAPGLVCIHGITSPNKAAFKPERHNGGAWLGSMGG